MRLDRYQAAIDGASYDGIDLDAFFALMGNAQVLKVFHAARQDIEIVWHRAGIVPHPVFDTQIAALVPGYGDSIAYDQLVERITGHRPDKTHRFTDWSRRPLRRMRGWLPLPALGLGVPKVALAENYWDEMGRGRTERVHTELHHRLVDAIDMPRLARTELATPALDRMTLNGLLATHRWLQPELLGLLGVLELQAGPGGRCLCYPP